jgi:hypothetical protein
MDYENLIYDFVEGRLDSAKEEEFFLAMASNEELRTELKQTMALESAFKKDAGTLKPSTRSTVSLFTRLGLPIPAALNVTPEPSAVSTNAGSVTAVKTGIFSRFAQSIFSTAITGAAAVIVYFCVVKPDIDLLELKYQAALNNEKTGTLSIAHDVLGNLDIPIIRSTETLPVNPNNYNNISKSKLNKTLVNNNIDSINQKIENDSNASVAVNNNDKPIENFNKTLNSSSVSFPENQPWNKNSLVRINSRRFDTDYLIPIDEDFEKVGVSVEFKSTGEYPMNEKPRIDYTKHSFLNNTGLLIMKNLPVISDNFFVGADIRQEYFYQKYNGIKDDGLQYIFRQYPNFLSASAVIRYILLDTEHFDAFVQAAGGVNNAGYIGRGLFGFRVSYSDDFYFVIGVEASNMWFKHANKDFTAPKYGINYGIGFNY